MKNTGLNNAVRGKSGWEMLRLRTFHVDDVTTEVNR